MTSSGKYPVQDTQILLTGLSMGYKPSLEAGGLRREKLSVEFWRGQCASST